MSDIAPKTNFIRNIIDADLAENKNNGKVVTRFPPEPNGYLHVGHAKSICLNFGIAADYAKGPCHLRFDDTNPANESEEYMNAIIRDVKWLGFDWGKDLYYSSDYFEQLYTFAIKLIKAGKAYVCSLSPEEVRTYRGSLTEPGKNSPHRDRSTEENLSLFEGMKNGDFEEGAHSLRAKIDMSSGNINLRDPMIYRIKKVDHHRLGNAWCIYPMYDFAHSISDAIEGITHSLCTLEFQDHRPLYDWFVEHCEMPQQPKQYEFSRLNLNYTITSKRKLKTLVEDGHVSGWNDPRMSTISGLRRRGFPAAAIRNLCEMVGISKQDSVIDMSLLEECVRDELNRTAPRRMAVLNPLKVILTNFESDSETLSVPNHPQNPEFGRRDITISKELYIDHEDFEEVASPGFKRLTLNGRARLMNGYVIECKNIIKNAAGEIEAVECIYLPETLGGQKPTDGTKVKGIIHWLDANNCNEAEVRIYDRLFNVENPGKAEDIPEVLNPESLKIITHAKIEPCLTQANPEDAFQFNRLGYFCADEIDYQSSVPVFNRVVTLRDGWKKS